MGDSSFFAGLNSGIRTPEVIMNSGPLPPESTVGYPYTLDGLPNAKINYGSTLLGDIDPYTYAEPDQISNQTSYLNIPNRIQKLVPLLSLPSARMDNTWFDLSHAVDDGDVAFTLRTCRFYQDAVSGGDIVKDVRNLNKIWGHMNFHPLINLATVNYILTGIQIALWNDLKGGRQNLDLCTHNWRYLLSSLIHRDPVLGDSGDVGKEVSKIVLDIVANYITPFGVAHGSERQGGQHEGTMAPVSWACNFVTTLYTDGYVRNLCNIWKESHISAGSNLCLELTSVPVSEAMHFTLNHYAKATVKQSFSLQSFQSVDGQQVLLLKPKVYHGHPIGMSGWRIALSYIKRQRQCERCYVERDDSVSLNGLLLEAAFGPYFSSERALLLPKELSTSRTAKRVREADGWDLDGRDSDGVVAVYKRVIVDRAAYLQNNVNGNGSRRDASGREMLYEGKQGSQYSQFDVGGSVSDTDGVNAKHATASGSQVQTNGHGSVQENSLNRLVSKSTNAACASKGQTFVVVNKQLPKREDVAATVDTVKDTAKEKALAAEDDGGTERGRNEVVTESVTTARKRGTSKKRTDTVSEVSSDAGSGDKTTSFFDSLNI